MTSRLLVVLVGLAACDPPRESEADAKTPAPAAVASPRVQTDTPAPALRATPLEVRLDAIRSTGNLVEIEVTLDRRLPATGASRPTLHVGDIAIRRSRRPDGALDRIVFLVDAPIFDTLVDGSTLIVRDRGYSSEQMANPPRLDKAAVTR